MPEPKPAFLTMVPTTFTDAGHALQLVDEEGRVIGNQLAIKLEQATEGSTVTITFDFDGKWLRWWTGLPPGVDKAGW